MRYCSIWTLFFLDCLVRRRLSLDWLRGSNLWCWWKLLSTAWNVDIYPIGGGWGDRRLFRVLLVDNYSDVPLNSCRRMSSFITHRGNDISCPWEVKGKVSALCAGRMASVGTETSWVEISSLSWIAENRTTFETEELVKSLRVAEGKVFPLVNIFRKFFLCWQFSTEDWEDIGSVASKLDIHFGCSSRSIALGWYLLLK